MHTLFLSTQGEDFLQLILLEWIISMANYVMDIYMKRLRIFN